MRSPTPSKRCGTRRWISWAASAYQHAPHPASTHRNAHWGRMAQGVGKLDVSGVGDPRGGRAVGRHGEQADDEPMDRQDVLGYDACAADLLEWDCLAGRGRQRGINPAVGRIAGMHAGLASARIRPVELAPPVAVWRYANPSSLSQSSHGIIHCPSAYSSTP